jgi:hypothetical protein
MGFRQKESSKVKDTMPGQTGIVSSNYSDSLANAVELAEFPACFSLLATFLDTRFFVVFTTLQLSFYPIYLQLLLQLSDGIFKVSSNFNFYHFGLRLTN